jgi:hypothetical protein
MPRPFKVYRTHIGFFDMVVAAHSQKEAMVAWGGSPAEFQKGFASVTTDEKATSAALRKPGVVFYRPFGSEGAYSTERSLAKVKLKPQSVAPAPALGKAERRNDRKTERARAKDAGRIARERKQRERENEKEERERMREDQKRERENRKREAKRTREEAKGRLDATLKDIAEEEHELERRRKAASAEYERALKDLA